MIELRNIVAAALILLLPLPEADAGKLTVGFLVSAGGLGDQSFNDMAYAGLGKAKKKYRFNLIHEETGALSARQRAGMERLIQRNADIIVVNGHMLEHLVLEYAPRHPEKHFIVNDYAIEGLPNVSSTVFEQHEGSFLAGVLAGSMTRARKIGFIGGVDMPIIHSFRVGFSEGVAHANADTEIISAFISPGGDFSGFDNPSAGYEEANRMYSLGIDIIFSAAGLTGNGVIQAARERERYVIGVDADQDHMAKGFVLTSMMKRLDRASFLEVAKVIEGKFTPGVNRYGLANGGVSLSPMTYTRRLIPVRVLQELKEVESDIISGKIRVTDYLTSQHTSNEKTE